MFRACVKKSPKLFAQTRLLGVCDGPISTRRKYDECLEQTMFRNGTNAFTVHDLPKNLKLPTLRAIASLAFGTNDIAALQFQFLSTYYGKKFASVDVAAADAKGREYQTRFVVALLNDRWHALPRCRSSKDFYKIADAMPLPERD